VARSRWHRHFQGIDVLANSLRQFPPRGRRPDPARFTPEQLAADLSLKCLDLEADRGLRQMQGFCCLRHSASPVNGDECT
jgi:hypothetical protein